MSASDTQITEEAQHRDVMQHLLDRLSYLREENGSSQEELESLLELGSGWIERFESGKTPPSLDIILSILGSLGYTLDDLIQGRGTPLGDCTIKRALRASQFNQDLDIHFPYGDYDAIYRLKSANMGQLNAVLSHLRNGLDELSEVQGAARSPTGLDNNVAKAIKCRTIASAFLLSTKIWPKANPSDLWWFIIYRAFCDPYNHPANFARLNLTESWKRTSGWALERVLVDHYGEYLKSVGIEICIANKARKELLSQSMRREIGSTLILDKVDVMLVGKNKAGEDVCFGVVHVKASFAERRTDDVPLSKALVKRGYFSPLWTMDCKSNPAKEPKNNGELGRPKGKGKDNRNDKRKDIENRLYFSGCFSYNQNTKPTPRSQRCKWKVNVCDFSNSNDVFSKAVIAAWNEFQKAKGI